MQVRIVFVMTSLLYQVLFSSNASASAARV